MTAKFCWLAGLGILVAGACGERDAKPTVGTETHWLSQCVSDAECGGARCLCGVCTKICASDQDCPAPPGPNSCIQSAVELAPLCGTQAPSGMCLTRCLTGGECGAGLSCNSGLCTPTTDAGSGSGGAGGFGGEGGASAAGCIVGPGRTYTTIQAAIDAEPDGAVIEICPGTYSENLNVHHDVSLVGTGTAAQTIVDGVAPSSTLVVQAGVTAAISRLTITGGEQGFALDADSFVGGGITNLGTLELSDAVVNGNSAVSSGGGIFNNGVLTILRSEISGNRAELAAGIMNNGTADGTIAAQLIVEDSRILVNSSAEGAGGIQDASIEHLDVHGTLIQGNSGCGILDERGSATFSNNQLIGNNGVERDGVSREFPLSCGGFFLQELTFTVTDTEITDNRGRRGAGMYLLLTTGTVSGGSFLRNEGIDVAGGPAALFLASGGTVSVDGVDFGEGADDNLPAGSDIGNIIFMSTQGASTTLDCTEQACQ